MTTNISIVVNERNKAEVVPHYFPLKRKHGQLLKDFGLHKHQRKAVYDLISTFMHANSYQHVLGEVAPSDDRIHNSGLRKSRSLGCINTIEQDQSACPLPLTNTDSESEDDTPTNVIHTVNTTSLENSTQSHANGAVVININNTTTNGPEKDDEKEKAESEEEEQEPQLSPEIYELEQKLKSLETAYQKGYGIPEKPDLIKYIDLYAFESYHRYQDGQFKSKYLKSSILPETPRWMYESRLKKHLDAKSEMSKEIVRLKRELGEARKRDPIKKKRTRIKKALKKEEDKSAQTRLQQHSMKSIVFQVLQEHDKEKKMVQFLYCNSFLGIKSIDLLPEEEKTIWRRFINDAEHLCRKHSIESDTLLLYQQVLELLKAN